MRTPSSLMVNWKGESFELFEFSMPMWHDDWHTAKEMGIVYLYCSSEQGDYWDSTVHFVKEDRLELAEKWRHENSY